MYAINSLKTDINVTLALMGDTPLRKRTYPDNEWGIALRHFDVMTTWFGLARMETREDSLNRTTINRKNPEQGEQISWEQWQEDNPKLFSILYIPAFDEAMKRALDFCKAPPPPLRDCLEHLANGNELVQDDLFVFVQMYAEFAAAINLLSSWDENSEGEMTRLRKARDEKSRERWRKHAALQITRIMNESGVSIQEARDAFAVDVFAAIENNSCPVGWSIEDYKEFLGKPDEHGTARLRKAYDQNLTQNEIQKLLGS